MRTCMVINLKALQRRTRTENGKPAKKNYLLERKIIQDIIKQGSWKGSRQSDKKHIWLLATDIEILTLPFPLVKAKHHQIDSSAISIMIYNRKCTSLKGPSHSKQCTSMVYLSAMTIYKWGKRNRNNMLILLISLKIKAKHSFLDNEDITYL